MKVNASFWIDSFQIVGLTFTACTTTHSKSIKGTFRKKRREELSVGVGGQDAHDLTFRRNWVDRGFISCSC